MTNVSLSNHEIDLILRLLAVRQSLLEVHLGGAGVSKQEREDYDQINKLQRKLRSCNEKDS